VAAWPAMSSSARGRSEERSLEYAVRRARVRLIWFLGHSSVGPLRQPSHLDAHDALPCPVRSGELVALIQPARTAAKGKPGDKLIT